MWGTVDARACTRAMSSPKPCPLSLDSVKRRARVDGVRGLRLPSLLRILLFQPFILLRLLRIFLIFILPVQRLHSFLRWGLPKEEGSDVSAAFSCPKQEGFRTPLPRNLERLGSANMRRRRSRRLRRNFCKTRGGEHSFRTVNHSSRTTCRLAYRHGQKLPIRMRMLFHAI